MTHKCNPDLDGRWWPAPAKLNLFLLVTGRRADGLHELQTLFQLLDWGDEVYLRASKGSDIVRPRCDFDVSAEDDLTVRAARLLQRASGCSQGAVLEVRKNIPIAAGLGGGSSNAATVLMVLNRLWGCGFSTGALADLALELGADVPLFVRGQSAIALGVGHRLEPVKLGRRHYLLVMPDIRISTAEVFSDGSLKRDSTPIAREDALAGGGRNDCEPVTCRRHPSLARVIDELQEFGPARMSGTGSSVFVPMPSRAAAEAAASDLKCRYNVRAVGGLDESMLIRALGSGTQD